MKSILNFYEVIDDLPKSPPLPVIPNPNQRIVDAARKASLTPVVQPSFLRDVVQKSITNPFIVKNAEASNATREQILGYKNKRSFSAPDPGKFRSNSSPAPVGSNNTTSSPDSGKFRDNPSTTPAPVGNNNTTSSPDPGKFRDNPSAAPTPVGNKQFMVDKSALIRQQLTNRAKLTTAKADAARAAVDYKSSHPDPIPTSPAPYIKPEATTVGGLEKFIPQSVPTLPDAAGAGLATKLLKKVDAPDILNRGAQVMSKLGDVTGYGK